MSMSLLGLGKLFGCTFGLGLKYLAGCEALQLGEDSALKTLSEDLSSMTGNVLSGKLGEKFFNPTLGSDALGNEHLSIFTGLVLRALTEQALEELEDEEARADIRQTLSELPGLWLRFVALGVSQPLASDDFLQAVRIGLDPEQFPDGNALPPETLRIFFAWFLREVRLERWQAQGFAQKLEDLVAPSLEAALASALVIGHPSAETAFKKTQLRFHDLILKRTEGLGEQLANSTALILQALAGRDWQTLRLDVQEICAHADENTRRLMEHGEKQHLQTREELLDALAAHVRSSVPCESPPASQHTFQGREEPLRLLTQHLSEGQRRLVCVLGPAGIGKTALAAQALHGLLGTPPLVAGSLFPGGVVYIDFYAFKGSAEAAWHALANKLEQETFQSDKSGDARAQAACARRRLLIILEGAEELDSHGGTQGLRGWLKPLAPENRVLILTRSREQARGTALVEMSAFLSAAEAAALFDEITQSHPPAPALRQQVLALLEGHPLAITWAASLMAEESLLHPPATLAEEWQAQTLPSLHNPENAEHTLRWLFDRSTRGLEDAPVGCSPPVACWPGCPSPSPCWRTFLVFPEMSWPMPSTW